jgi:hypothetical protein
MEKLLNKIKILFNMGEPKSGFFHDFRFEASFVACAAQGDQSVCFDARIIDLYFL